MKVIAETISPTTGEKIYEVGFECHREHPISAESFAALYSTIAGINEQLSIVGDEEYFAVCPNSGDQPSMRVNADEYDATGVQAISVWSAHQDHMLVAQIAGGGRYEQPAGEITVFDKWGCVEYEDVLTDRDVVALTEYVTQRQQRGDFTAQRIEYFL